MQRNIKIIIIKGRKKNEIKRRKQIKLKEKYKQTWINKISAYDWLSYENDREASQGGHTTKRGTNSGNKTF